MDERYVELIAYNLQLKLSRKWKALTILGLIFIVLSLMMFVGKSAGSMYVALFGAFLFMVSAIFHARHRAKRAKQFIEYYKNTGKLPEWPGDNESS